MQRFRQLLKRFEFGGLSEQDFRLCSLEIKKQNVEAFSWIMPLLMIFLFLLFVVSLIPGSGEEPNRALYLFFLMCLIVEDIAFHLYFRTRPDKMLYIFYIFLFTIYAFGIYEALFMRANSSSTVLCVFLVTLPMLSTDSPLRLSILNLLVEVLLLIIYVARGFYGDQFIVIESLSCSALGMCCGYVIQKTKFSDIRNHRMLQIQQDTDMMTGAGSRVAYIHDLGMLGDGTLSAGVVYADVNGLKIANDKFGHEAGDRLIKDAFSLMIKYFHEGGDRIYRVGGDEFVIISLGSDRTDFEERFYGMTKYDENREILSGGMVWLDDACNAENSIKQAEAMMYEQKKYYYQSHPELDRRKA
ncbi:MAG: diguanylate cyclase [Firmicutes bacterium]|nr:diguanylate cyclase [Bacillota bacterium]